MTITGIIHLAKLISRRQLHVISRSVSNIKPASSTPLNLNAYNLPIHDQMHPNIYIPLILYYPNSEQHNQTKISNQLKNSLSQTLSMYYPFAGRLISSSHVDCNDEGVPFVEAQIGCKLSHVLDKPPEKGEDGILTHLFPPGTTWDIVAHQDPNLVVQLNHFACGGIAVAASLSHRLADASALCSFIRYWATLSRHSGDYNKLSHLHPQFWLSQSRVEESNVVADDESDSITKDANSYNKKHLICKEIMFHNTKIAKLKADLEIQAKSEGALIDLKSTRNELVTALLYRCKVAAAAASNSGVYGRSVFCQTVNLRSLIHPPLPETSVGNFMALNHFPTSTQSETNLNLLVDRIRRGKMQLRGKKSVHEYEFTMPIFEEYAKNKQHCFGVSSLCNFPIYDGMDFGWGMPIKATMPPPFPGSSVLMDTSSGDGIKAIVGLEEQEMEKFQVDKELLTYASFKNNP